VAVALLVGFVPVSSVACFGSFRLTRKFYDWHKHTSQDKWIRWMIFLFTSFGYGFTSMVDTLFANSVEFWTGSNPIDTASAPAVRTAVGPNGELVKATFRTDRSVLVQLYKGGALEQAMVVRRDADQLVARNLQGQLLARIGEVDGQTQMERFAPALP